MASTTDYLNQLSSDRLSLVSNLETQGINDLTGNETFTELVPRVLDIQAGGIEVVNGKLDSGYYSSSGTIAPGTFINTSVVTDGLSPSDLGLTESSYDNSIQDIHYLKDDYYILRAFYYLYIFKGTTKICSVQMPKTSGSYIIYSTEDGKDIFLVCGNVDYTCHIYHYKFENNILTLISNGETKSVGSNYYSNVTGFTCISNDNGNYKFLIAFSYDSYPYAEVIGYDGSTWTQYDRLSINSYRCSNSNKNGAFEIVQVDQNNYLFANGNNSSSSFYKGMYMLTVSEDYTLTKTELGGIELVYPILAKVGSKCIVCAKDANSTSINLIVYDLLNNANVLYSTSISDLGTGISSSYINIKIVNINDNNYLIVHPYYDGSNTLIKCIPCIINDDGSVSVGVTQELNKDGTKFKSASKFGTGSAINIAIYNELISGILNGLDFAIGVKYVSQATSSITGITKTECTESVAGDIYLLSTEVATNE